jgi:hypothetical protein
MQGSKMCPERFVIIDREIKSALAPQILCAIELNRRLAKAGAAVDVIPLHPGNVLTEVVRSLPPLIQRAYRTTLANVLLTPTEGV